MKVMLSLMAGMSLIIEPKANVNLPDRSLPNTRLTNKRFASIGANSHTHLCPGSPGARSAAQRTMINLKYCGYGSLQRLYPKGKSCLDIRTITILWRSSAVPRIFLSAFLVIINQQETDSHSGFGDP